MAHSLCSLQHVIGRGGARDAIPASCQWPSAPHGGSQGWLVALLRKLSNTRTGQEAASGICAKTFATSSDAGAVSHEALRFTFDLVCSDGYALRRRTEPTIHFLA